jgi:hypothetical protein
MESFKKTDVVITLFLALMIALFPESFKEIGHSLIRLFNHNKIEILLVIITLILIYICKQCSVIKKQTQNNKKDT